LEDGVSWVGSVDRDPFLLHVHSVLTDLSAKPLFSGLPRLKSSTRPLFHFCQRTLCTHLPTIPRYKHLAGHLRLFPRPKTRSNQLPLNIPHPRHTSPTTYFPLRRLPHHSNIPISVSPIARHLPIDSHIT
jgi:hypothetical protein